MITLAFYKGTLAENDHAKLFDRAVCWRTRGRFSHVEVVLDRATGLCASSSFRDHGVRMKHIDLGTGRWEFVTIPGDLEAVRAWFVEHDGEPYDWFSLLGFVLPFEMHERDWWFCSEAVAESLGLEDTWRLSPVDLYHIVKAVASRVEMLRASQQQGIDLHPA